MDKIKTSEMFSYIINFVDYITLFNLKYTNKRIRAFIKELHLDNVMDLRNTKYHKENNVIYKLLTKHAPFLNKVILEFREINDTLISKQDFQISNQRNESKVSSTSHLQTMVCVFQKFKLK